MHAAVAGSGAKPMRRTHAAWLCSGCNAKSCPHALAASAAPDPTHMHRVTICPAPAPYCCALPGYLQLCALATGRAPLQEYSLGESSMYCLLLPAPAVPLPACLQCAVQVHSRRFALTKAALFLLSFPPVRVAPAAPRASLHTCACPLPVSCPHPLRKWQQQHVRTATTHACCPPCLAPLTCPRPPPLLPQRKCWSA